MSDSTCQRPLDLTALIFDADRNPEKSRECCQVFARQMRIDLTVVIINTIASGAYP